MYKCINIETINHKIQTSNEAELIDASKDCISESRLESLITESKFLTIESLEALIKVYIFNGVILNYQ